MVHWKVDTGQTCLHGGCMVIWYFLVSHKNNKKLLIIDGRDGNIQHIYKYTLINFILKHNIYV